MIGLPELHAALAESEAIADEHGEPIPERISNLDSTAALAVAELRAELLYQTIDIFAYRNPQHDQERIIKGVLAAAWIDGAMVGIRAAREEDRVNAE